MNEFEKLLKKVKNEEGSAIEKTQELMKKTPTIKEKVFNNLPPLFKRLINEDYHSNNNRKKDIMLLSSLTTLSSQFSNTKINWHHRDYSPNLYFFLAAKSGQGKSIMSVGVDILSKQREKIDNINKQKKDLYDEALNNYKRNKKEFDKPEEPIYQEFMSSANITAPALVNQLGIGSILMYDTEADTMANNLKQEHGDYSTTIRKGFEHEGEIKIRVGSETVKSYHPNLSICISGTLNQAMTILASNTENGTFNRFMTYIYAEETKYKRYYPSETKTQTLEEYYGDIISPEVQKYIDKYNNGFSNHIYYSKKAMDKFHDWQIKMRKKSFYYDEKDMDAILKRNAIVTFRIAAIFTLFNRDLNSIDVPDLNGKITIYGNDIDLENAITISNTLLDHTKLLFYSIEDKETILKDPNQKHKAINLIMTKLPNNFKKSDVDDIVTKNNISTKTGERAIKTLVDSNKIEKLKYGQYQILNKKTKI